MFNASETVTVMRIFRLFKKRLKLNLHLRFFMFPVHNKIIDLLIVFFIVEFHFLLLLLLFTICQRKNLEL